MLKLCCSQLHTPYLEEHRFNNTTGTHCLDESRTVCCAYNILIALQVVIAASLIACAASYAFSLTE